MWFDHLLTMHFYPQEHQTVTWPSIYHALMYSHDTGWSQIENNHLNLISVAMKFGGISF